MFSATPGKYIFLKLLCNFLAEDPLLDEILKCICIKNFSPFIGIIAGGISSLENMGKRGAHTILFNFRVQPRWLKGRFLMFFYIGNIGRVNPVPAHVQHSKANLAKSGHSFVKIGGLFNLFY